MTEPFLIAHVVRGEPAFDIAEKMECPMCLGTGQQIKDNYHIGFSCDECEALGHWWIIPTSGHRARPYWYAALDGAQISKSSAGWMQWTLMDCKLLPPVPTNWPDHYPRSSTAPKAKADAEALLAELGL